MMTYASASGTFGRVNVMGLPTGLVASLVYNATNLTIVISAAGAGEGEAPTRMILPMQSDFTMSWRTN